MAYSFAPLPSLSALPKNDGHVVIVRQLPLPARFDSTLVAALLGFGEHDIPVLISAGLLKPLADPTRNAIKYFAAREIEARASNIKWLNDATGVLYKHWQGKNERKSAQVFDKAA